MTPLRLTFLLLMASAGSANAQFAPPAVTTPSVTTPTTPTYGAQPYNPAAPTGFDHPDNMGFGSYQNATQPKGHRTATQNQRRFRGY